MAPTPCCRLLTVLWLVTTGLPSGAQPIAQYLAPGTPDGGGLRDLVLIYHGSQSRVAWTASAFQPYVARLGDDGRPREWLFDSFLFMEFATDDGTWLHHYREGHRLPAVQDWKWLADAWFRETTGLVGLEQCVAATADQLGPAEQRVKVLLALPVPLVQDRAFGPLPGDPEKLDFSLPSAREEALQWYIRYVQARWAEQPRPHLELAGFYWTAETINDVDLPLVRRTSEFLREQGRRHYWIPYFGAQGLGKWRQAGLAGVMLQPNYFFLPEQPAPSLQRFQQAAKMARAVNCGLEMEFDGRALTSEEYRRRLVAYLDAGVHYGWMNGALLGYYEGGGGLGKLAASPGLGQELYQQVCDFVKGSYQPSGQNDFRPWPLISRDNSRNLALASRGAKVIGAPARPEWGAEIGPEQLLDGNVDFYGGMSGFAAFFIPGGFMVQLPEPATVARTQTLFFDLDDRFFRYRIDTSLDGQQWDPAVDKDTKEWRGWQVDRFPPRPARFVRLTCLHNSKMSICQVVEFEAYSD